MTPSSRSGSDARHRQPLSMGPLRPQLQRPGGAAGAAIDSGGRARESGRGAAGRLRRPARCAGQRCFASHICALRRLVGMNSRRILIVGGGPAGVRAAVGAAERLRSARARHRAVELVNPDPWLVLRPRLYESDLSGVRVPLDAVLGPIGVVHRRGTVTEIDAAGSTLPLPDGAPVLAVDTYAQAQALHRRLAGLRDRPGAKFSAVVVGGGFTGVEIAAELAGMLKRAARSAGRRARGPITLIERGPNPAPDFGPRARSVIERSLRSLGVEVKTGTAVVGVHAAGVVLADGSEVEGELVVWSTGPRASRLTGQVPARRDPLGRVVVDRHLASGVEGIWVAGDSACASVDGRHTALMSCQHAMAQGRLAGQNAAAVSLGEPPRPYRQPLYLTCLDLGGAGALLTCGFDRDTVLATGAEAKRFKRHINRCLIYPPANATAEELLKLGKPEPSGPVVAALTRLALRSRRVRRRASAGEDRAALFAAATDDGLALKAAA